jgi:CBS domain containing-hemolysin-like protein
MSAALCVLLIGLGYFSGYIVSLYGLAVYVDPEELPRRTSELSARKHATMTRLVSDPRGLVQVATIYRYVVLVVITVCTLSLVDAAAGPANARYWYPVSLLVLWLVFIFLVEYLPRRTWRKQLGPGLIRYLWYISLLNLLLSPVVRAYRRALQRGDLDHPVTEEEKEEIVERAIETLAEQAGFGEAIVEEDEKQMIGHIFLLDQTLVKEIMSPRIDMVAINRSTSFTEIRNLVRRDGHSRYPVYEESIDKIIGILYVKDLFINMPRLGDEFVMNDLLRRPYFVPETKVIGELLSDFLARKLHLAIVVDDYGGVAGLVTLEDILEEIVGEIQDEHDSEDAEVQQLPDGGYLVEANVRLERIQKLFETDHEQDENATIGGLIYDLVGSVPREGSRLQWNDLRLEVQRVEGQRIRSVRVSRS